MIQIPIVLFWFIIKKIQMSTTNKFWFLTYDLLNFVNIFPYLLCSSHQMGALADEVNLNFFTWCIRAFSQL